MKTNQRNSKKAVQNDTFQNATGKVDYTLMNDYMFHAVLQTNEKVLRGLIGALLRLKVEDNLCAIFKNLKKKEDYSKIKPAYHIGILNFTPFQDYPEFYATNKMMNLKYHYIFNDNFTLNVLDLTQIHLATEEDKAWGLDYWAKLFKSSTWEDLNMLAQQGDIYSETVEAIYGFNRDEQTRYICEMIEEGDRVMRTYTSEIKRLKKEAIALKKEAMAQKEEIAEKDSAIAEMASEMLSLKAQIEALQQSR